MKFATNLCVVVANITGFIMMLLFWGAMTLLTMTIGGIMIATATGWQSYVVGGTLCAIGFASFCYLKFKSMDE